MGYKNLVTHGKRYLRYRTGANLYGTTEWGEKKDRQLEVGVLACPWHPHSKKLVTV